MFHGTDELSGYLPEAKRMALKRWASDVVHPKGPHSRVCAIGAPCDNAIASQVQVRIENGLCVDDAILRNLAIAELKLRGEEALLRENGGQLTLGSGWCQRFWKRHNLVARIPTTKMRGFPADFEAKKATYLRVGTSLIAEHNIPPDLVFGLDETSVQFVSNCKKTRAKKGVKKVRLLGIGEEKACITVTLCVTETGLVLPPQLIFCGKTARCHPKTPPSNGYYAHTESHWQTPASFIEYLAKIIIPARMQAVEARSLCNKQMAMVKLDLHYSHKDEKVLEFMRANYLVPLFVPAGCTDILQECDTVVNKVFKAGVKTGFKNFLHNQFSAHLASGGTATDWKPKLTSAHLKPYMRDFVGAGLLPLMEPTFRATISKAFAEDGCFEQMRSASALAALAGQKTQADVTALLEGTEADKFDEVIDDEDK